jgi:hypothetical protein
VVPKNKYPKLLKFFYARHPWAKKRLDHKLYIVTPTAAYHINQRAFGHFFRVRVF